MKGNKTASSGQDSGQFWELVCRTNWFMGTQLWRTVQNRDQRRYTPDVASLKAGVEQWGWKASEVRWAVETLGKDGHGTVAFSCWVWAGEQLRTNLFCPTSWNHRRGPWGSEREGAYPPSRSQGRLGWDQIPHLLLPVLMSVPSPALAAPSCLFKSNSSLFSKLKVEGRLNWW